jgi:glycerophosphoryl diester phosphodiesterase
MAMSNPRALPSPSFERIGHRGSPRAFLENSLPSFEHALARHADAVELDVHATADGTVVVHHDPAIRVAVDRKYVGRELAAMTWSELSEVELTPGVHVPTLADVLEFAEHRLRVYIEIKGKGIETHVVAAVHASDADCAVHSFDHAAVRRVRALAPEIRRGILFDSYPSDVVAAMRAAGAHDVWPDWRLVDDRLVSAVHGAGGRVLPWTVNDSTTARCLLDLGVDGLCTDDLGVLDPFRTV